MTPKPNPFVESLRDSEAVRLLSDEYPSFLSYVDTHYLYRFVNRAYEAVFDVRREEIIGKHVEEIWGRQTFEALKGNLDHAFAGERFAFEGPFHDRYIITSYVPHTADDEVVGTLVFSQDITELKAARAASIQSERMASLGRLVAGLLHEINTPLGVLGSNLNVLQNR